MSSPTQVGERFRKVGLVTGLLEEAQAFRPRQGEINPDCPFYCREAPRFVIACAGIGKVNAAMAASYLVAKQCDLLLSLGVAGRLRDGPPGPHWIAEAIQHDYGALRSSEFARYRAGSLPFGQSDLAAYEAIDDPGLDLPAARILTGDCFVEDRGKAAGLADALGGDLIDMETGAIAQVAQMAGISWAGIRSVSDSADDDSVSEFQKNLDRAAQQAAQAADRFLNLV